MSILPAEWKQWPVPAQNRILTQLLGNPELDDTAKVDVLREVKRHREWDTFTPGKLAAEITEGRELQAPHLDLIDQAFRDLEAGKHQRIAIFAPPRHGKSSRAARWAALWWMSRHPDARVAVASYSSDLAEGHSRWVRDTIENQPQLGLKVSSASRAMNRWDLVRTPGHDYPGGFIALGVGTGFTGKGAHLLIVDDPVKDAQEASSPTVRESTWAWWQSVSETRLEPGARICLIQCMTGDTPVLMGDGVEKPLRDVRVGDVVATYENGSIATSIVRNWANQGSDPIFAIKMKSGTVVRANARHPFLTVQDGVEAWVRTDSLKTGNHILRVIGVNGAESSAPLTNAENRPEARACACGITANSDGTQACGHPRTVTLSLAGADTSATVMGSTWPIMIGWSPNRAGSALSASNPQPAGTLAPIGTGSSAWTTATTASGCAVSSAMTATLPLATESQRPSFAQLPTIYAIEADEVLEVVPCGIEDVYDVQIDRTENFIANGLVSHNTRWDPDDLAGRLLSQYPDDWHVLNLPALAETGDVLDRAPGDPLWPERYDLDALHAIRQRVGTRWWISLYQQRPTAPEGAVWKQPWIDASRVQTDDVPDSIKKIVSVDPSGTASDTSDAAGIVVCGYGFDGDGYVFDDKTLVATPLEWGKVACRAAVDWDCVEIVYEQNQGFEMARLTIDTAWDEVCKADPRAKLRPKPRIAKVHAHDGKRLRAEPVAALYESGRVHHVGFGLTALENEMVSWTGDGASPNRIDAAAQGLTYLMINQPSRARSSPVAGMRLPQMGYRR